MKIGNRKEKKKERSKTAHCQIFALPRTTGPIA